VSCSYIMTGCLTCSSNTTCTTCDTSNHYVHNGSACATCASLLTGCVACSNNTVCTTCDSANYYVLSGSVCVTCASQISGCLACSSPSICTSCSSGFLSNISACQEICGDGLLFVLPCDDGNTINGDGCSSTCQVE
jgi:proprotein convertase subtilisin/kexin type 5